MKRRDFLIRIGGAALAVPVAANLVACGDDGGTPPTPDAPPAVDAPPGADAPPGLCATDIINPPISANHGHEMTVPAADIEAGVEVVYQIQGTSAHPHTVTVTVTDFEMLKQGQSVTIISSNDAAHTHDVTLVCA